MFIFCNTVSYVSSAAAVQYIVPSSLRGQATAFWYLVNGIIGIGGGPFATAWINTHLLPGAMGTGLGLAMLLAAAPVLALGLAATVFTFQPYDRLRIRLRRGVPRELKS